MSHYHDTVFETPENVVRYEYKATKQDRQVLAFLKANPCKEFTPLEIWDALIKSDEILNTVPYTSIRRSCTNLERNGLLQHGMMKKMERMGRVNGTWKYVPKTYQSKLF